jgi:hypothetical protein
VASKKKSAGLLFDEVLPQAQRTARSLLSLDPQENVPASQQALEMALGFVPGIGQAMALRDIERARRANDPAAAALAATEFVPFGRLAGAVKKDIFIGKKSKKWDSVAAKRAEEMEKLGASPEEIWRETGTFRGPEGALRQEISDLEATGIFTHLPPSKERRSVSALRHPEFAEAYPEFASISQTGLKSPTVRGEFQRASGRESPETGSIIAQAPNEEALASTMLHEFQHAVQDFEGFAPGGSPKDFRQRAMPRDIKEIAFKKDMREMAISQKLQEAGFPVSKGKMVSVSHPKVMKAAKELAEVDPQVKAYLDDIEEFNEALKLFPTPQQQYVRLAGEAEARAVEARKKMTPAERRSTFPYESYDVPTNRLIIKR